MKTQSSFPYRLFVISLFGSALVAPLVSAHAASGVAVSRSFFGPSITSASSYNTAFDLGLSSTTSYSNSAVSQSSEAAFGILRLLDSVSVSSSPTNQYASTTVRAGWIDSFLIDAPGLTGQVGYFNGSVVLDLTYSASGSVGNSQTDNFSLTVDNDFRSDNATYASLGFNTSPGNGQSYNGSVLNFTIPFIYGTAFDVAVYMTSSIQLGNNADYSVTHNAGNTALWNGITSVQNSAFTPLAPGDYSLTTTSGTDYVSPIPSLRPTRCWDSEPWPPPLPHVNTGRTRSPVHAAGIPFAVRGELGQHVKELYSRKEAKNS